MSDSIQVINRQRRCKFNRDAIVYFCSIALRAMERQPTALSVALVGNEEMRLLNLRYRQKNYETDVLSFSYEGVVMDGSPFLGEIVIAPDVAARQAVASGTTAEKVLRKLLVHGILHLLGYDHETDKGRMNRIQAKLMRRKFFMDGPRLAVPQAKR
jgi:probable rRNA maturation factor